MTAHELVPVPVYLGPVPEGFETGFIHQPPLAKIMPAADITGDVERKISTMIDTGAAGNFIQDDISHQLGLVATGSRPSIGFGTVTAIQVPTVELEFVFHEHQVTRFKFRFALLPGDRGFGAVLGRDFLRFANFRSNGFDGRYTLSIPKKGRFLGAEVSE